MNIKRKGCSAASIPEVNSHLFPELISSFYTAGCSIDLNNTDQSEHAFMFDHMIPAFQMIFAEIRDLLTSQLSIQNAESSVLIDFNGNTINAIYPLFFLLNYLNKFDIKNECRVWLNGSARMRIGAVSEFLRNGEAVFGTCRHEL